MSGVLLKHASEMPAANSCSKEDATCTRTEEAGSLPDALLGSLNVEGLRPHLAQTRLIPEQRD